MGTEKAEKRSAPKGRISGRGSTRDLEVKKGANRRQGVVRKPALEVPPSTYQPTKKELEADVSIDTTPEELFRRAQRPLKIGTK